MKFIGVHGDRFAMSSLKGKVVLVNFWATSCVVSMSEMPKIEQRFEGEPDIGKLGQMIEKEPGKG